MEIREKALFDNYPFQVAVYMDPRFSFYGSKIFSCSQKERIIVSFENQQATVFEFKP